MLQTLKHGKNSVYSYGGFERPSSLVTAGERVIVSIVELDAVEEMVHWGRTIRHSQSR